MGFKSTSNFLNDLVISLAGEELRDYSIILIGWKNIVGRIVADKAKPVNINNGVLKVAVRNNIWLQELILYKHKIRSQYKKKHGLDLKDIIFYVNTD
jgi:predicted nucleic acid-binding Zn ribbon protein